MGIQVVVGAGPVGMESARLLAEAGHDVILTSRTVKRAPPGVRIVQADATDGAGLANISAGAETILMCAMAPYHRWPTEFFPILDGTVQAAEAIDARLIVVGNVYGYGANAPSPLRSDTPLDPTSRKGTARTIMWQRALRSKAPALEVRASDYLGHGAIGYFALLALPALRAGDPAAFIGDLDARHAWAFTKDVARTAAAAVGYKGKWDRAFHVPSQYATPRELASKVADALGKELPPLRSYSHSELEEQGLGELIEMSYLFDRPLRVDSTDTEELLGIRASSLDEMVEDTLLDRLS